MGLDSRLDEHGRPLPQEMYDALHAGDETAGGYNANVLIVVHIPGGTGPITAISIPRDDYVDLAGCPTSGCKGKIKQAYGFAYQHVMDTMDVRSSRLRSDGERAEGARGGAQGANQHGPQPAGHPDRPLHRGHARRVLPDRPGGPTHHRVPERGQLRQLLGGRFPQGRAADRRSAGDGVRAATTRRQRRAVHRPRPDPSPAGVHRLPAQRPAARRIAVESQRSASSCSTSRGRTSRWTRGSTCPSFVQNASGFTDRGVSLYTLPITEFGQDSAGEDINTIDVATIRKIVHNLVGGDLPTRRRPAAAPHRVAPRNRCPRRAASCSTSSTRLRSRVSRRSS